MRQAQAPSWLYNLGLDDDEGDFLLTVKADYMAKNLDDYKPDIGNLREDILLYLAVLTKEETQAYQDPARADGKRIWFGEGWYKNRVIKEYGGYYKVYPDPKYMRQWDLLSVYPDSTKPLPKKFADFYVATCHEVNNTVATASPFDTCNVQMVASKNLLIEFSVSEQNLHLLPEIKKFLVNLIESWEVK